MADMRNQELKDDAGNAPVQQAELDIPAMLKEQGFTLEDMAGPGKAIVVDAEGNKGEVDLKAMASDLLSQDGVDVSNFDLKFKINDPSTAFNKSAVEAEDRLKLSVGNDKGKLNYLSEKFGKDNVKLDENKGLVVNKDGAWYQVDPSGLNQYFQDPWELTRDLADLIDLGINAAVTTYGIAKGTAAGSILGPAGAVAGGIAGAFGSGAAAGSFRTLLGRAVGTYEASAEETAKDIALEGIFSMFGQGIVAGAKPAWQGFRQALQKVNKLPAASKAVLANTIGRSSGMGETAFTYVAENPVKFTGAFKNLAKESVDSGALALKAQEKAQEALKEMLEESGPALTGKYGELLENVVDAAKNTEVKLDFDKMVGSINNNLNEAGIGKITAIKENVEEVIGETIKEIKDPLIGNVISKTSTPVKKVIGQKTAAYKFNPLSLDEVVDRGAKSSAGFRATPKTRELMDQFTGELNRFSKLKNLKGARAASAITNMNKFINGPISDVIETGTRSEIAVASSLKSAWDDTVRNTFNDMGLATEYKAMQDVYQTYAKEVNFARSALKSNNPGKLETVYKQLTSDPTKNTGVKATKELLVDLLGDRGKELSDQIALNYSISKAAPWIRPDSLGWAGIVMKPLAAPALSPRFAAQVAKRIRTSAPAESVPEVVKRIGAGTSAVSAPEVAYSLKTLDFIKSLSPAATNELLQNSSLLTSILSAPEEQTQGEMQLNQEMGNHIKQKLDEAQ